MASTTVAAYRSFSTIARWKEEFFLAVGRVPWRAVLLELADFAGLAALLVVLFMVRS
jgi:hypothetical protein